MKHSAILKYQLDRMNVLEEADQVINTEQHNTNAMLGFIRQIDHRRTRKGGLLIFLGGRRHFLGV